MALISFIFIYFMCISALLACMYVHHMCPWCLLKFRSSWIPWNWNYKWLGTTNVNTETEQQLSQPPNHLSYPHISF